MAKADEEVGEQVPVVVLDLVGGQRQDGAGDLVQVGVGERVVLVARHGAPGVEQVAGRGGDRFDEPVPAGVRVQHPEPGTAEQPPEGPRPPVRTAGAQGVGDVPDQGQGRLPALGEALVHLVGERREDLLVGPRPAAAGRRPAGRPRPGTGRRPGRGCLGPSRGSPRAPPRRRAPGRPGRSSRRARPAGPAVRDQVQRRVDDMVGDLPVQDPLDLLVGQTRADRDAGRRRAALLATAGRSRRAGRWRRC